MTAELMPRMGDMPSREGDLTIEGRGIEPIPESARYGSTNRVFTVWFTPNLVPAAFFIGTLAAASFLQVGWVTGLMAIVLGNLIGSFLVGALASMGPATGMAQMPLSRLAFGKSITVPALLNWASCIGWDGVNSVFGAAAISLLTGLPFLVSLVIIVIAQGALGVFGYEAIHQFERWGAIALGVVFAVLTVSIIGKAAGGLARTDGLPDLDGLGAFVTYTAIVASFVVAWGLYASDYTRYLPANTSRPRIFWYTVLGLTLSAGWIEVLGLAVADQATGNNVGTINGILGAGLLGSLAMVAIAVGTVAVNAMNDYTGSLSLQAAGIRVPRIYSAIVVAGLGFVATIIINNGNLLHNVETFLLLILYWVTPWAAVVLVDWWLRGRRADVGGLTTYARLPSGWLALTSLVIGFIASVPFQQSELGFDLATKTGLPINTFASNSLHYADIAFVVGFVVAGAIYWIGSRMGVGTAKSQS